MIQFFFYSNCLAFSSIFLFVFNSYTKLLQNYSQAVKAFESIVLSSNSRKNRTFPLVNTIICKSLYLCNLSWSEIIGFTCNWLRIKNASKVHELQTVQVVGIVLGVSASSNRSENLMSSSQSKHISSEFEGEAKWVQTKYDREKISKWSGMAKTLHIFASMTEWKIRENCFSPPYYKLLQKAIQSFSELMILSFINPK